MGSPFTAEDEIAFWGNQLREHMEFISLGIVQPEIVKRAKALEEKWARVIKNPAKNVDVAKELIDETEVFQYEIADRLKVGEWIGWLSYSFINHLILESTYFSEKLSGFGYNLADESRFWLDHDGTESAAAEKLIDPSEEEVAEKVRKYIKHTKALGDKMTRQISRHQFDPSKMDPEIMKCFEDFVKDTEGLADVLTNISPTLLEHVLREGERSLQIFDYLLSQ